MTAKTQQLQIRVTPQQKAALKRQARAAGQDVSTYVLSRLTPSGASRFGGIVKALRSQADHQYALAELNDFLFACPPAAFVEAVADANVGRLSPLHQNYVAAMVEQASAMKSAAPPPWTQDVVPLETPHFATPMKSLRMHLIASAPVPFKRRNIFVDAGIGSRV